MKDMFKICFFTFGNDKLRTAVPKRRKIYVMEVSGLIFYVEKFARAEK